MRPPLMRCLQHFTRFISKFTRSDTFLTLMTRTNKNKLKKKNRTVKEDWARAVTQLSAILVNLYSSQDARWTFNPRAKCLVTHTFPEIKETQQSVSSCVLMSYACSSTLLYLRFSLSLRSLRYPFKSTSQHFSYFFCFVEGWSGSGALLCCPLSRPKTRETEEFLMERNSVDGERYG